MDNPIEYMNNIIEKLAEVERPSDEAMMEKMEEYLCEDDVEATVAVVDGGEIIASLPERNIHVIKATKVGAKARTGLGKTVEWTEKGLKFTAPTWVGGEITINHEIPERGKILSSELLDDEVVQVIQVDDDLEAGMKANKVTFSIEAKNPVIRDGKILAAIGTGTTAVFYPHKPMFDGAELLATDESENPPVSDGDNNEVENTMTEEMDNLQATIAEKDTEIATLKATTEALEASVKELKEYKENIEEKEKTDLLATLDKYGIEKDGYESMDLDTLKTVVASVGKVLDAPKNSGATPVEKVVEEDTKLSVKEWQKMNCPSYKGE